MAPLRPLRPLVFFFDLPELFYAGWTDATYWNGWVKVWVDRETLDLVMGGCDWWESDPEARQDALDYALGNPVVMASGTVVYPLDGFTPDELTEDDLEKAIREGEADSWDDPEEGN